MSREEPCRLVVVSIDDDPGESVLLGRFLERIASWSIAYRSFPDVKLCLASDHPEVPDVVLLDHHLGADCGLDSIGDVRQLWEDTPVILMTGRGDERLAVASLQAGAADYLPKARLSPSSLERSIRNCLEKARLQREVRDYRRSLERSNEDLARKNREIASFYHSVSHEPKTPLTSAREFTSLLQEGFAGELEPLQREYLEYVRESCEQMTRQVNDLLDCVRLETGKLGLHREETNFPALARRAVSAMKPTAEKNGIALRLEIAGNPPTVLVDPVRIRQVLDNLMSNALKFSSESSEVLVKVDYGESDRLSVAVTDHGRGIPTDELDRIFERSHQVSEEDATVQGGLGMGLHICKQIILLHGGEIHVASEWGRGSTFSFTVPVLVACHDEGTIE